MVKKYIYVLSYDVLIVGCFEEMEHALWEIIKLRIEYEGWYKKKFQILKMIIGKRNSVEEIRIVD